MVVFLHCRTLCKVKPLRNAGRVSSYAAAGQTRRAANSHGEAPLYSEWFCGFHHCATPLVSTATAAPLRAAWMWQTPPIHVLRWERGAWGGCCRWLIKVETTGSANMTKEKDEAAFYSGLLITLKPPEFTFCQAAALVHCWQTAAAFFIARRDGKRGKEIICMPAASGCNLHNLCV